MASESSANAGSKALSGNEASPCTLPRADSRNEDRDDGRSGVVGRGVRGRDVERWRCWLALRRSSRVAIFLMVLLVLGMSDVDFSWVGLFGFGDRQAVGDTVHEGLMAEPSDAFELTKSRVDRICGVLQKCQGGVAPGPVTLCLLSMGMSPV